MPSFHSTSVVSVRPSSTVTTPSLPTLVMASAIFSPISRSLLAAIEATCAISSRFEAEILIESFSSCSTMRWTASSMPRLIPSGEAPAATFLRPSSKIASARTTAVVVPSPATSAVLVATSRTMMAPMFS